MMAKWVILSLFMLAALSAPSSAAAKTVTVGHGGGYNYPTVQAAVNAATTGDTVLVYPGTYVENVRIGGKNIVLTSTKPLDPATVAATILDGGHTASVVTFAGAESASCVLRGFTIQHSYGFLMPGAGVEGRGTHALIENNVITRNGPKFADGGGVWRCDGVIQNNVITGNGADRGAGLYGCNGTIRGNTIASNKAWFQGPNGGGGGLHSCNGTIEGNTIENNWAAHHGGGLYGCNGTIQNNAISGNTALRAGGLCFCAGTIRNNRITSNSATNWPLTLGGGLTDCHGTIENNTIVGNSAMIGGGLFECYGMVRNNLILGNWADNGGGAALCLGTVQNNTIVGNSARQCGGGMYLSTATVVNCIVWSNSAASSGPAIYGGTPPTYSCIEQWTGGGLGNISVNPRFLKPTGNDNNPDTYDDNDYRLLPVSPCIDKGNPAAAFNDGARPPGLGVARNDMGAYGGPPNGQWASLPLTRSSGWVLYP